jgi:hypothetical protein
VLYVGRGAAVSDQPVDPAPTIPTGIMPDVPGIKSRLPLSPVMYQLACRLALLAKSEAPPYQPTMALPMGAVIHAAASLEAFLNEAISAYSEARPEIAGPLEAIDRLEVDGKWLVAAHLVYGRSFAKGEEPFQSFSALVKLRNALVHYRAPFVEREATLGKLEERLKTRFQFTEPEMPPGPFENMKLRADWPIRILNADCARWACMTARNMALAWSEMRGPLERRLTDYHWSAAFLDGRGAGPFPAEVPSIVVNAGPTPAVVDLAPVLRPETPATEE